MKKSIRKSADFLFEAATLKRLKRTGWQILGENEESIAEHSYMVGVISYLLAKEIGADAAKTVTMGLFHDLTETRVGDIYKLADKYVRADVMGAARDAFSSLKNPAQLLSLTVEYEEEKTLESKIVHDADTLALLLELKPLSEKGNIHAKEWLEANLDALRLPESKELALSIKNTDSQNWWKQERQEIHKSFKK